MSSYGIMVTGYFVKENSDAKYKLIVWFNYQIVLESRETSVIFYFFEICLEFQQDATICSIAPW